MKLKKVILVSNVKDISNSIISIDDPADQFMDVDNSADLERDTLVLKKKDSDFELIIMEDYSENENTNCNEYIALKVYFLI